MNTSNSCNGFEDWRKHKIVSNNTCNFFQYRFVSNSEHDSYSKQWRFQRLKLIFLKFCNAEELHHRRMAYPVNEFELEFVIKSRVFGMWVMFGSCDKTEYWIFVKKIVLNIFQATSSTYVSIVALYLISVPILVLASRRKWNWNQNSIFPKHFSKYGE